MKKLPGGVDLTNPAQKLIAAVLLAIVGIFVVWVTPPLRWFAENWIMAVSGGLVTLFLIFNYEILWSEFKRLSFVLTKKIIYGNAPYYLYKFHEFLVRKYTELNDSIKQLDKIRLQLENTARDLKSQIDRALKRAEAGDKLAAREAELKNKTLQALLPRWQFLDERVKNMLAVYQLRVAEAAEVKLTIDSKVQEYELFKEMDKGVAAAGAAMSENSPEFKEYQLAVKALEDQMFTYAANVNDFDRQVKPQLERAAIDQKVNEQSAQDFLEQYKKTRQLPELVIQSQTK